MSRERRAAPARTRWSVAAVVAIAIAAGCGAAPAPSAAPTPAPRRAPSDFDACGGQPPPEKAYLGVLREARCDQDVFLTMAGVAEALGVACGHCHVAKPGGTAKDFEFPTMTRNKQVANWMKHQLVDRLRRADGSPVTCASCHQDAEGRAVAKILGEPRDRKKAMEWMSLVLVNDFTRADGSKLRCKDCHEAPPGMPGFRADLILAKDLAALPVRDDRPPPGRPEAPSVTPASATVPAPSEAPPPTGPAQPADAPARSE